MIKLINSRAHTVTFESILPEPVKVKVKVGFGPSVFLKQLGLKNQV
jgi:hypothetical protein